MLVVGSHDYPDSFEWHVTQSLGHIGCAVELFHSHGAVTGFSGLAARVAHKTRVLLQREPERRIEAALLRAVARFEPELILVLLGSQLSPKAISRIRSRSSAPIVCWCQDQMTTLGRQFLVGCEFDAVFVKDRYLQDLFSRMIRSSRFYYLPEACNPRMHRPIAVTAADRAIYGCDIMIAGTVYYYRQEILRQLEHFNLKVWGSRPDWLVDRLPGRFMGRYVYGDDKVRSVLCAGICLNTLHYAEVNGLNCRAFELAGCGGFQLISFVPALAEHFEPEVEVATYRSVEELKEKVMHYLKNPAEAAAIAERGRARAHRDHTYERRLEEIMRVALP